MVIATVVHLKMHHVSRPLLVVTNDEYVCFNDKIDIITNGITIFVLRRMTNYPNQIHPLLLIRHIRLVATMNVY